MRSGDLKKAKRAIRRAVLERRDALTATERDTAGAAVAARTMALPEMERARLVMVFWSFGSEVPTRPLLAALHAEGVSIALPRIAGADLEVRTYLPGEPVAAASFGAMEPTAGQEVGVADLDVIVTPAVAFDPMGHRIGYGGGFYDRLFVRAAQAVRVGLAYDLQVLEGPLPTGHFDLPVDAIVTELRVLRPSEA